MLEGVNGILDSGAKWSPGITFPMEGWGGGNYYEEKGGMRSPMRSRRKYGKNTAITGVED